MATGLFAILDDVALLLDDAVIMSKIAAKKTAGLLGDDLAVNAEKATGFHASRELPVIWAITKGSCLNKLIILPIAFLLSAYMPWTIVPILLLGGAYLSYEGVEKIIHMFAGHHSEQIAARETDNEEELLAREATKIKSAIRTDFILSIEIIVITLGVVLESSIAIQIIVVSIIALVATVGVYSLVALIVRMDDAGLHLIEQSAEQSGFKAKSLAMIGQLLVNSLPWVIRLLGIVGTLAMLLVGGGMYVHNIEAVHQLLHALPSIVGEFLAGLVVGVIVLGVVKMVGVGRKAFSS